MLRTRGSRFVIAALTIAASASLAAPPAAIAEPAPAPAEIADSPQAAILAQARTLLATLNPPAQLKATLEKVITFLDGSGGGGPELPPLDGPVISQFFYPTLGKGCIGSTSDSVGAALAVPGPAALPPPGPKAGQTGFVFTALGTKSPTPQQNPPITVQWVNLDTRKSGSTPLTDEAKINPDGPVTLSAVADTGSGRIAAVLSGSLSTTTGAADLTTCSFLPTLGFFTVA
ncbi:Rv1157c family protein [Nocardia jejuensis]|uniref:Rv1157c family protein n=1 Tax=Nocardia jejuensis TaxID=328049 RepID=UPI000A97FA1B